jgi:hypothetical protein
VSSIEPNDGGGELNGGEEVSLGLVISGGDGTELLEFGEEVLDQMAGLEKLMVIIPASLAVASGWDHRRLAGRDERPDDPFIGVKRLVGDQGIGLHARQEVIGPDKIMRLAAGQEEADRVAQRIDQGVDFGAQSAPRAADCLVFAGFFWAPALC